MKRPDEHVTFFSNTINFQVDTTCTSFATSVPVFVTGPWCNWDPVGTNCLALSDSDADGVWTGAKAFAPGSIEYKYEAQSGSDSNSIQEDLIDDEQAGGTCAPVTDYVNYANRKYDVVDAPIAADAQYFGSCAACPPP